MAIETNFNQSPYFDDFDENKNFHRVLFRPGYSVQARELTQLQTILQNQVERFANEVLIDGTIVTGGGLVTDITNYVKLQDKNANGDVLILSNFFANNGAIANCTIEGESTGVTGKLVWAVEGSETAAPDYFTIYCHYTNSGSDNSTKAFADDEALILRTAGSNTFVLAAQTISSGATGRALKANISDGVCYHKGHFIRIPPQSVIVGKYTVTPNAHIGLTTVETVVDSNEDSSLLDNATGATNYAAPGANRLKIVPTLTVQTFFSNTEVVANTESYFSIATVEGGSIVQRATDTIYSDMGKFVAERVYDAHGDFVIQPFNLRVREHLKKTNSLGRYTSDEGGDANKLVCEVEKGVGYVAGNKIQLQASRFLDVDKATDFIERTGVVVGQTVGNYVYVNEAVGGWDFQGLRWVSLRSAAQKGITDKNFGNQAVQGTQIGSARVRGFQWDTGVAGSPTGQYRLYLFDVQMDSGYSFADVRSVVQEDGAPNNIMADIVLEGGIAKIREPNRNTLLFPVGQRATKTLSSNEFVFRTHREATATVDGLIDITNVFSANAVHAGGNETVATTGSLTNTGERDFIVASRNATTVTTAPHTGYIQSYTSNSVSGTAVVTGSGTNFSTTYQAGDLIKIGSNNPQRIVSINSATSLTIANTDLGTASGLTSAHRTAFPPGYIFDLSANGTITSTTSSITINLQQGLTGNLESTCAVDVYFNMKRTSAIETAKTLQDGSSVSTKERYVKLNIGSHAAGATGPWPLGVSDVYRLEAVYRGSNTAPTPTDSDVTNQFELDNGQKDAMYDTAQLRLKADSTLSLDAADGLLVKFSYFGRSRTTGIGFLTVDSYPVDDANTANTTAITTQEIPVFRSPTSDAIYDLRDHIDFRPIRANTCEPKVAYASAPTNPAHGSAANTGFDIDDDGVYMCTPDENFECTAQFYLPRRDRVVVTKGGAFQIVKGVPDQTPQTPSTISGSMSLGTLDIPPYPSLSPYVAKFYKRGDYAVKLTLDNNRRYTMADLRAVESRVKSLEYYSTMNLLEQTTKNRQISSETSVDRFKNGFFVDNMGSHVNSDTTNPYYRAAIDKNQGFLRPTFTRSDLGFEKDLTFTSSGVTKKGNYLMLNYTSVPLITQPYASKLRNPVQELLFNWRGQVTLDPPADNTPDITQLPDVQIDFSGFYDAIETIAQETGLTSGQIDWGNWNVTSLGANDRSRRRTGLGAGAIREREGVITTLGSVSETITLGNTIENISTREYMRSREVRFTGARMKPNTRVYAYFDDEKVSNYCTPCDQNFNDTGAEGGALITDQSGSVFGKFRIPDDNNLRFRVGTKRFVLKDIADPATEAALVTTSAHGEYQSNPLDITMRGTTIDLQVPQFSQETVVERQTLNTVADGDRSWWDPIAQTFNVNISGTSVDGVYITKMDLYFGRKDTTLPITLQIREVQNGFPTETIVPNGLKTLAPADINISDNASVATTFTFDTPVFLKNETDYAFVIVPAGNSDQYAVWSAQLGGTDALRPNTLINKQTYSGILFSSSNDKTWNPIQDEDLKFTMYRANFATSTGTVYVESANTDFFTVSDRGGAFRIGERLNGEVKLTFANNDGVSVGDILQSKFAFDGGSPTSSLYANGTVRAVSANGAGVITVTIDAFGSFPTTSGGGNYNYLYFPGNSSPVGTTTALATNAATGFVDFYDNSNDKLYAIKSAGGFKAGGWVRGQKSGATAKIRTIDDLALNTLVPKLPEVKHARTNTAWAARTTSSSGTIGTEWTTIQLGQDNNFYDAEKKVFSKSNEDSLTAVGGSKKSLVIRGTLSTENVHISPVVDLSRANAIVLSNIVNNDASNEDRNVGSAYARYISKKITLADGQDAEDMIVYVNAFKPYGTDVKVYARLLNAEDGEPFSTKAYTPLVQVTAANVYSTGFDGTDVREYEFAIAANTAGQTNTFYLSTSNTHAYLNTGNNNVVTYWGNDGAVYHTYKTFAIKIVMTAAGSQLVPQVDDLRVIALQK